VDLHGDNQILILGQNKNLYFIESNCSVIEIQCHTFCEFDTDVSRLVAVVCENWKFQTVITPMLGCMFSV